MANSSEKEIKLFSSFKKDSKADFLVFTKNQELMRR